MNHKKIIIQSLDMLGQFLDQFSSAEARVSNTVLHNDVFFDDFKQQLKFAQQQNGWFSKDNICYSLKQWSKLLKINNLENWLAPYSIPAANKKTVAIIMAGNIPLVGFHDFLSALVSGHQILVKQSSNDRHILPYLAAYLMHLIPTLKTKIKFTEDKLTGLDAVIATGSNNTARYFEAYFKNIPSIIRKNRNSVCVLTGNESDCELKGLAEDIFRYYGLGCRSVSKLFVPKDYSFDNFFKAIYDWHPIINSAKYANNYDYNKAVYLMSEYQLIENGFLMLKQDVRYASPIATIFYEFYEDLETLKSRIESDVSLIQCVVSKNFTTDEVAFGSTQHPKLSDYADGHDTVDFLLKI
ncbi:MAG: acyl-CoA reductase [Bacteroidota bacterium]|nr:acyl-CoA reductase [Bacteroidota bacterium]